MLLYHADGLSSREQTIPLLIIYTFRVGDHQICEDPGLSSKFPNRNSYVEFPILRAFCHFSPTSSLLCVEIAARQIDISSPLYIFHNCFTFQFFNDMCLLSQASLYLLYSFHQGLASSFVWFLSKRSPLYSFFIFILFFLTSCDGGLTTLRDTPGKFQTVLIIQCFFFPLWAEICLPVVYAHWSWFCPLECYKTSLK